MPQGLSSRQIECMYVAERFKADLQSLAGSIELVGHVGVLDYLAIGRLHLRSRHAHRDLYLLVPGSALAPGLINDVGRLKLRDGQIKGQKVKSMYCPTDR